MPKLIATHEVDDVDHWLASEKRAEVFGTVNATDIVTFTDPTNPSRVGISLEVPDVDALLAMLQSEDGATAMKHDGVRPDTVVLLVEKG